MVPLVRSLLPSSVEEEAEEVELGEEEEGEEVEKFSGAHFCVSSLIHIEDASRDSISTDSAVSNGSCPLAIHSSSAVSTLVDILGTSSSFILRNI